MKSRAGRGSLESICWVLGIVLLGGAFGARAFGEVERRQAIAAFERAHTPDQALWSENRIRAYANRDSESGAVETLPAAVLRLARVGLEVPVYAGTSERNLNRGAALVEGTAVPGSDGNIAIAAHRDGYFRLLESVVPGDVIELDDPLRQRSYRVTELSIVEPTDVRPLHATDHAAVTLVTCYPFYFVGNAPQRFIVRAVAVD